MLNFSEWQRPQAEASECAETIIDGELPPRAYALLHASARLSPVASRALARLTATVGITAGRSTMIELRTRAARAGGLILGAAVAVGLCSCTRVAAYERGRLAHPSMSARQRMSAGQAHLYAIREGARGGSLGAGSGCGCN